MKFVFILILYVSSVELSEFDASYQVSIREKHGNKSHICNGIVIHKKFILTTANCLYLPIENTNSSVLLSPDDISIFANANNPNGSELERNVVSIIPHNKFNNVSYDNDIAVVKLDKALPLAVNQSDTGIQWLDASNGSLANQSCFATIFNYSVSSNETTRFYSQVINAPRLEKWACDDLPGRMDTIRTKDMCMEYWIADTKFCNISSNQLQYSGERGTAYVCENKLLGILADINHPINIEKCIKLHRTTAYYTDVSIHRDWLLKEIKTMEDPTTETPTTPETKSSITKAPTTEASNIKSSANIINVKNVFILINLFVMFNLY